MSSLSDCSSINDWKLSVHEIIRSKVPSADVVGELREVISSTRWSSTERTAAFVIRKGLQEEHNILNKNVVTLLRGCVAVVSWTTWTSNVFRTHPPPIMRTFQGTTYLARRFAPPHSWRTWTLGGWVYSWSASWTRVKFSQSPKK